jgi:hypothetical protein
MAGWPANENNRNGINVAHQNIEMSAAAEIMWRSVENMAAMASMAWQLISVEVALSESSNGNISQHQRGAQWR